MEFLSQNAQAIYAAAFFSSIGLACVWESLAARRALTAPLRARWVGNFTLYLTGAAATRLLLPGISVAAAFWAQSNHFGLFNIVSAPDWLVLVVVLIVMDLLRYSVHWLLHAIPAFWRLHSMHHTDSDYDFTTSFRFHPLEVIIFFSIIVSCVTLLGAPVATILLVDSFFAFSGVMVHGNIRIPLKIDAALRLLLVTPDLHRTHHSIDPNESACNFGSLFSWWDRLFGTYTAQPAKGHENMGIGLAGFEDIANSKPLQMLIHPFVANLSNRPSLESLEATPAPATVMAKQPPPENLPGADNS